jgi:tRNA U55 pseudouridine synthase TruB
LKRTAVAGFSLDDAVDPETTIQSDDEMDLQGKRQRLITQHLLPVNELAFEALKLPSIRVPDDVARFITSGRPIDPRWIESFQEVSSLGIFSHKGVLLAIISATRGRLSYKFVNPIPDRAC